LFTVDISCKITVLLFLGFLLPYTVFTQEQVVFVAEVDTIAYRDGGGSELIIHAGELITTNAIVGYGAVIGRGLDQFHLLIMIGEPNNIYCA